MVLTDDTSYDDIAQIWIDQYFHYDPEFWPAWLFLCLFSVFTIYILAKNIQLKATYMYIMVFAGLLEIFGYFTRVWTAYEITVQGNHNKAEAPFIVSILSLLLAPIFVALVNYIVVGRLMAAAKSNFCCIRSESLSNVFLASDVICVLVQGAGGGILGGAKTKAQFDLGQGVILAGLIIQLFFFTIFNYIGYNVAWGKARLWDIPRLQQAIICIISTNVLLYIRNFYRVVDYAMGQASYIQQHEWILYLLEATPMLLCWVIYSFYHFDVILPETEFKAVEESVSAKQAKGVDSGVEMAVGGSYTRVGAVSEENV